MPIPKTTSPLIYCFIICCLFSHKSTLAQNKLTIGFTEIKYLFSSDVNTTGAYNKIATVLFDAANLETYFLPPLRADSEWARHEVDCLFPANSLTMTSSPALLSSLPVNTIRAFIFSNKKYNQISDFKNKLVGIRRGFSFGGAKNRINAKFVELNSDEQGIKMLEKNRVVGILAYYTDVIRMYKSLNIPTPFYNDNFPVYETTEHLVCFNTPQNKRLIEQTNKKILRITKSEELEQWLNIE